MLIVPVAQLDRVPGYEPGGREFESLRARYFLLRIMLLLLYILLSRFSLACTQESMTVAQRAEYVSTGAYYRDVAEAVSQFEVNFFKQRLAISQGSKAVVFDVDETLISNISYLQSSHYMPTTAGFYQYLSHSKAVGLSPVVQLAKQFIAMGYRIFIVTGRPQRFCQLTKMQLQQITVPINGGDLYCNNTNLSTVAYKKHIFSSIKQQGYTVVVHVSDQCAEFWSGQSLWQLKLPNPFYQVAADANMIPQSQN